LERATGIEPVLPSWEFEFSILHFQYLQNRLGKTSVYATHTVHALPDLHIVAGRFAGRRVSSKGIEHRANGVKSFISPWSNLRDEPGDHPARPDVTNHLVALWVHHGFTVGNRPATLLLFAVFPSLGHAMIWFQLGMPWDAKHSAHSFRPKRQFIDSAHFRNYHRQRSCSGSLGSTSIETNAARLERVSLSNHPCTLPSTLAV
jgi:hypothetical protein